MIGQALPTKHTVSTRSAAKPRFVRSASGQSDWGGRNVSSRGGIFLRPEIESVRLAACGRQ